MTDILADLAAIKSRAVDFPKRRSDAQLYALLAECLELSLRCEREGSLEILKAEAIRQGKATGKRRAYFESTADAPLVIGRLVFEGEKRRDASWRYTACIREAIARQISPAGFVTWLTNNGGLNALFRTRKVAARSRTTRTLHLLSPVEMPKQGVITLVLRDNGAGFYHVIEALR